MKIELYNDHFENAKRYMLPKAQLIIADIPYNIGSDAYASSPRWWKNGNVEEGKSEKAGKKFFATDDNFNIENFFQFCTRYLKKEDKNGSPAMIVFCSFEQIPLVIDQAKKLV